MSVTTFLAARRKALFGVIAVILAWGPIAQAAHFPAAAWWGLAGGIAGVFGVHAVKNDPVPWQPAVKMVDGDSGQVGLGGLVTFLVGFILGALCAHAGLFGL